MDHGHHDATHTQHVLLYGRVEGKRPVGRLEKQWLDVIEEGYKILGITLQGGGWGAGQLARNKGLWSRILSTGLLEYIDL